jgi:hypothetical protein
MRRSPAVEPRLLCDQPRKSRGGQRKEATKVTRLINGASFSKGGTHQSRRVVLRHCGRKHKSVDASARWRNFYPRGLLLATNCGVCALYAVRGILLYVAPVGAEGAAATDDFPT